MPGRVTQSEARTIVYKVPLDGHEGRGVRELNVKLQAELNPAKPEEPVVEKFGWQFRVRDGDIGQITKIDPVEREVTVKFDQREVVYDFGELDEVALAYAIYHPQIPGFGISRRRDSAGDAAILAAPTQSCLHRHHAW